MTPRARPPRRADRPGSAPRGVPPDRDPPHRKPPCEPPEPSLAAPREPATASPTPEGSVPGTHALEATSEAVDLLLCGSPREVLARIVPGDPLRVRDAVAEALRAECVFLDADRVHLRALARLARSAPRRAAARAERPAWIRDEVAGALAEILREEAEAPRADAGATFAQFARPLGLDPEAVRRGCTAFNRLPHADRAAFFALVVRHVGLDALARETGESPSELGRRARRGLDAVLRAHHPDLPPPARSPAATPPHEPAPAPPDPDRTKTTR